MQSSRSIGVASTSGRGSSSSSLAAPQRVRTGRARVARVQAFVDPDSSLATIQTVSQVVTTCCIAAGAFMLLSKPGESLPEQDRLDNRNSQPCPVCGGSGFEECLCSRWSDGDVGCNSCSKTGYMRCRGCGGGGTAVPLMVRARK
ncbi:hypothetical protein CHLRE_10g432100v5 [Chlamydomonas reinhardtii]|uniref:Uncharacterized protein n=1 Tax=Chlamydomonas reinhardtii TaxID=3055 RepID=A8IB64_CHLRE|nr:uncharacterized protein CHLRE_10g432100v5 [Chlamydomonas reinhardtii]PNW77335.1 hypothetical protein CHLRE_10g432100v5 [Chlamydomonas reinhardtii]|eukprot:XP_001702669.1 stress related protein [Chlamydomonas reinhardtii]